MKEKVMKETITTHNRYSEPRTITCIDEDKGIFEVSGVSAFVRVAPNMFDFEGGPMLMVGEEFYGYGTIAGVQQVIQTTGEYVKVLVSVDYNAATLARLRGVNS